MSIHFRHLPLALAAGALLVACSATVSPSTPPPSAAAGGGAGSGASSVSTASGALGTYLTGADGRTLYVFTKDSPNASTCSGTCAQTWPAFTVGNGQVPQPGSGVTGMLATFARADGTTQVTVNGMPLYYYSGDSKAGDTNGQGKLGVWFVAPASGQLSVPSSAPTSPPSRSPYGY